MKQSYEERERAAERRKVENDKVIAALGLKRVDNIVLKDCKATAKLKAILAGVPKGGIHNVIYAFNRFRNNVTHIRPTQPFDQDTL